MTILDLGDPVLNKILDDRTAKTQKVMAPTFEFMSDEVTPIEKSTTDLGWDVELDGTTIATGNITDDTTETASDDAIPAELRMGRRRVFRRFKLNAVAVSEAWGRAPEELSEIFNKEIDNSFRAIKRGMNEFIYTGTSHTTGSGIVGLNLIADPAQSYAGISPVTYPIWKPGVILDNGGVDQELDRALLDEFEEECYLQEVVWDAVIISPAIKRKYADAFDKVVSYSGGEPATAQIDLGRGEFTYNGLPMLVDPQCPSDTMYFINTGFMEQYTFLFQGLTQSASINPQARIVGATKLGGHVVYLAQLPSNNSAVFQFEMYTMPQMRYFNRRQMAVITNIDTTIAA